MKKLTGLAVLMLMIGCNEKTFTCGREPFMGQPERQCSASEKGKNVFHPTEAYCFHSSMNQVFAEQFRGAYHIDGKHWSTDFTNPWCTPTLNECNSLRDGVGKQNDQPPVKTPCKLTPASEDPTL